MKMSASVVEEETYTFAASGPVISVSSSSGCVKKLSPEPSASKAVSAGEPGASRNVIAAGSR